MFRNNLIHDYEQFVAFACVRLSLFFSCHAPHRTNISLGVHMIVEPGKCAHRRIKQTNSDFALRRGKSSQSKFYAFAIDKLFNEIQTKIIKPIVEKIGVIWKCL